MFVYSSQDIDFIPFLYGVFLYFFSLLISHPTSLLATFEVSKQLSIISYEEDESTSLLNVVKMEVSCIYHSTHHKKDNPSYYNRPRKEQQKHLKCFSQLKWIHYFFSCNLCTTVDACIDDTSFKPLASNHGAVSQSKPSPNVLSASATYQ